MDGIPEIRKLEHKIHTLHSENMVIDEVASTAATGLITKIRQVWESFSSAIKRSTKRSRSCPVEKRPECPLQRYCSRPSIYGSYPIQKIFHTAQKIEVVVDQRGGLLGGDPVEEFERADFENIVNF